MCPPETQQMADLADAAAARERRRRSKLKSSATESIEGDITLEDLRVLVEQTDTWPADSRISLREHKSYPGEPGSTPAQITVTRT